MGECAKIGGRKHSYHTIITIPQHAVTIGMVFTRGRGNGMVGSTTYKELCNSYLINIDLLSTIRWFVKYLYASLNPNLHLPTPLLYLETNNIYALTQKITIFFCVWSAQK